MRNWLNHTVRGAASQATVHCWKRRFCLWAMLMLATLAAQAADLIVVRTLTTASGVSSTFVTYDVAYPTAWVESIVSGVGSPTVQPTGVTPYPVSPVSDPLTRVGAADALAAAIAQRAAAAHRATSLPVLDGRVEVIAEVLCMINFRFITMGLLNSLHTNYLLMQRDLMSIQSG